MNLAPIALAAAFLLAACRSNEAAPERATFDLSAWQGKALTGEEFVAVCQQVSGFNFTYDDATGEVLRARTLKFEGAERVEAKEFERYLDGRLEACGLESEPVGPPHLRVLQIRPRGS